MATAKALQIGYSVSGFGEVAAMLEELGPTMQNRIMADAVSVACKPIRNIARSRIRNRTGALRRSISIAVRNYRNSGNILGLVGPDKRYYGGGKALKEGQSRRGAARPSNYAHLVEFGHWSAAEKGGPSVRTTKGYTIRSGDPKQVGALQRRWVPAHPFMRPAADLGRPLALAALKDGVAVGQKRELGRLRRKHRRQLKKIRFANGG